MMCLCMKKIRFLKLLQSLEHFQLLLRKIRKLYWKYPANNTTIYLQKQMEKLNPKCPSQEKKLQFLQLVEMDKFLSLTWWGKSPSQKLRVRVKKEENFNRNREKHTKSSPASSAIWIAWLLETIPIYRLRNLIKFSTDKRISM